MVEEDCNFHKGGNDHQYNHTCRLKKGHKGKHECCDYGGMWYAKKEWVR